MNGSLGISLWLWTSFYLNHWAWLVCPLRLNKGDNCGFIIGTDSWQFKAWKNKGIVWCVEGQHNADSFKSQEWVIANGDTYLMSSWKWSGNAGEENLIGDTEISLLCDVLKFNTTLTELNLGGEERWPITCANNEEQWKISIWCFRQLNQWKWCCCNWWCVKVEHSSHWT